MPGLHPARPQLARAECGHMPLWLTGQLQLLYYVCDGLVPESETLHQEHTLLSLAGWIGIPSDQLCNAGQVT